MAFLYKGTLSAGGTLAGPLETTMDEWGNTIVTATFVKQGNALATLADAFDGFDEMATSWDILSRNGTYDIGTGLTTIQEDLCHLLRIVDHPPLLARGAVRQGGHHLAPQLPGHRGDTGQP